MPETVEIIPAQTWYGGGQLVTGADVVRHLDLTLTILERDGWVRTDSSGESGLKGLTKSSSIRDMLYGLVTAVRDFGSDRGPHTLLIATYRASDEGSDADTRFAAERCLQAAIRGRYGLKPHVTICINAWATRQGRTFDEVRELLAAARELAIVYGPTA
jgi:hypothetical protein